MKTKIQISEIHQSEIHDSESWISENWNPVMWTARVWPTLAQTAPQNSHNWTLQKSGFKNVNFSYLWIFPKIVKKLTHFITLKWYSGEIVKILTHFSALKEESVFVN